MVQVYAIVATVGVVLVALLGYQTWAKGELEKQLGAAQRDNRYLIELNKEQEQAVITANKEIARLDHAIVEYVKRTTEFRKQIEATEAEFDELLDAQNDKCLDAALPVDVDGWLREQTRSDQDYSGETVTP